MMVPGKQPYDIGAIAWDVIGADLEVYDLTGGDADLIGLADNALFHR